MSDVFVAQIVLLGCNFPPKGFAFCRGQILPIAQNTALFSLLGTQYGGNGTTNFALPDLQGRVPLGFGQGPGLSDYSQGQNGGAETVVLGVTQVPSHTHVLTATGLTVTARARSTAGNQVAPVGNVPADESTGTAVSYSSASPDASMNAGAVVFGGGLTAAAAGTGLPHQNRQPYVVMNYCIALVGIFPARS